LADDGENREILKPMAASKKRFKPVAARIEQHMKAFALLLLALGLALAGPAGSRAAEIKSLDRVTVATDEVRDWRTQDGRPLVRASVKAFRAGGKTVSLRKPDGTVLEPKYEDLSREDRKYLFDLLKKRPPFPADKGKPSKE
jgi:hypothetical protein